MTNEKQIKWLYKELPRLVALGVLSETHAEKLRAHYGMVDNKPAYNIAFIVIGIIGALLVGGGIILIFAYNWDSLSLGWRTALSFAPLVVAQAIYGYAFFKQKQSVAWVEGTSVFLMLMLASSIALVSQTYHLYGDMPSFLWNWLVLSIPLMYLLRASLVTIIFLIGSASWATQVHDTESVWYWALLGAALPHLIGHWRKPEEPIRRQVLGWAFVLTLVPGWFGTIESNIVVFSLIGTSLIISCLNLLSPLLSLENDALPAFRPFRFTAAVGTFILLFVLTYNADFGDFYATELWQGKNYDTWAGHINFVVLLLLAFGYGWLVYRQKPLQIIDNLPITLLPFFAILLFLISQIGPGDWLSKSLANLYLLTWGILLLRTGIRARDMARINLGMFVLLSVIAARFFDTNWSLVVKGIAFVLLGMGFLLANVRLARRVK